MPKKKTTIEIANTKPSKTDPETKTVKEEEPVQLKTAAKVTNWIKKINKSQAFKGKAQVRLASEVKTPYYLRRPTGILGLDLALGGGFHAGGGIQIYGAESVGKTHMAFQACAMHQKLHGDNASILVYGTEIRTDKGFARKSHFCVAYSEEEIEEFASMRADQGLPAFTKEEKNDLRKSIGSTVFLAADTADTGFDALVDALENDVFNIILIESLGALLTKEVDEGKVGDAHYAGSSRVMTQFQNKIYPLFMLDRENGSLLETTIIGINQARSVIGGSPRGPKTRAAAGAYAWKHGQLASIELNRGANIRPGKDKPITGKEVHWTLTKGKAGTHDGKAGSFNFYHLPTGDPVFWKDVETLHMGGVDLGTEAVEVAAKLGIFDQAGTWYTWEYADGKSIKKQGKESMADVFLADPELMTLLRKQCVKKSGILVRY